MKKPSKRHPASSSTMVRSPHRTATSRELERFREIQGFVEKELFVLTERLAKDMYEQIFGKFSEKEISHGTRDIICTALLQPSVQRLVFLATKNTSHLLSKGYTNLNHIFPRNSKNDVIVVGIEADKLLRRIQNQYDDSRRIPLPTAVKDGIRKSTYGKQPREAAMSDKVRDAIKNGEHPGAFIYRELIRPSKHTLQTLAREIDVHYNSLTNLKTQQTSLSPEMAAKLSHYFGKYSTQDLLTLQAAHDAKKADRAFDPASLPAHQEPTPA